MMVSASRWITLLSLLALSVHPAGAGESKLTNEDIVRMTALQRPEAEILKAIREADEVAFDLSEDVVSEMLLVNVSANVIKAMKQKAGIGAPPDASAQSGEGVIDLVFRQEEPPAGGKRPGLPLTRAAFFLICLDPTHVPDNWTANTPLAQKFPRHHLLWFHEPPLMAGQAGRRKGGRPANLPLPAPVRVKLPGGSHPIEAGIAVWAPDQTWIPVALASGTLAVEAGGSVRLVLSVGVHKPPAKEAITVAIVEPAAMAVPSGAQSPAP